MDFSYLINVCVLETCEFLSHRFEVHWLFDVRQIIRNIFKADRFREDLVSVNLLQTIHDSSQKIDEWEALELCHLMHGIDQFALSLLAFPDQLTKKSNTFQILPKSTQQFSLIEHLPELVLGLFDDGRVEGDDS